MAQSNTTVESVDDSVDDRGRRADSAGLARTLDAQWVGCRGHVMGGESEERNVVGARHGIVHERARKELAAVWIIDRMLKQSLADALHDTAMDLALEQERIDGPAEIVDDRVALDYDPAGIGIDFSTSAMWQPLGKV